jgi:hypothetical protein
MRVSVRWRPDDADTRLAPWWLSPLFFLFALLLVPWIVWLVATLPSHPVAAHWQLAWGGFDIGLALLLAGTSAAMWKRSPFAEILAAMTAGVLVCDAWFDTVTSRGTGTLAVAVAEAVLVELPLAVLCIWIAINIERVLADARPFLTRAGFRIERRRLVPPDK